MKTNKIISIALLSAIISTIGLTGVSASYGEGKGQGQKLSEEERAEVQNMSQEEREEYMEERGMEMKDDDNDGIPNKDDDDFERSEDGSMKSENAGKGKGDNTGNKMKDSEERGNSVLKSKYKNTYEKKYGSAISRMNDDQLNTFISKIDDITEKVEVGDYSDETREKFNAMLDALRELAEENLDEEDNILDGLFN